MADKRDGRMADESYELDLDETLSDWEQVAQEAVAAVEKIEPEDGEPQDPDGEDEIRADEPAGDTEVPGTGVPGTGAPSVEEVDFGDLWVPADSPRSGAEETVEERRTKDLYDKLVRTLADFDNFRKRTEREKEKIHRYALFDVLKDFLSVFDNLERALAASGSAEDLKTGVQMIARQFADLLGRYGVEAVEAVDKPFDPTVHEAVLREEKEDVDEPTVVSEFQRGYQLHDRLLRPALVTVAMPAPKSGGEAEAPPEDSAPESPSEESPEEGSEESEDDEALGRATEVN